MITRGDVKWLRGFGRVEVVSEADGSAYVKLSDGTHAAVSEKVLLDVDPDPKLREMITLRGSPPKFLVGQRVTVQERLGVVEWNRLSRYKVRFEDGSAWIRSVGSLKEASSGEET